MQVAILGGTGPAGCGLAARLTSVGVEVVIGSRAKKRAAETCDRIKARWSDRDLPLSAADNERASRADIVIVATPWDAAAVTAESVARALKGKVVISMANALARVGDEFQPLVPPRGSMTARERYGADLYQVGGRPRIIHG